MNYGIRIKKNLRPARPKPLVLFVHHDWDLLQAAATDEWLEREFDVLIATTAIEAIEQIVVLRRLDVLVLASDFSGITTPLVTSVFRQFFPRSSLLLMQAVGNSVDFFDEGISRA